MLPIKPFAFNITDEEIEEFTRECAKILHSAILILGEYTSRFEQAFAEFIGVKHAITVNKGAAAARRSDAPPRLLLRPYV